MANAKQKPDQQRGERIKFIRMDKLGLRSQEELASLISREGPDAVTRGAVANWEQGKDIALKNARILSRLSGIPVDWILDGVGSPDLTPGRSARDPDEATVPLVGYVGAGSAAHYYAVSQGDLDRAPAPAESSPDTVAVEIRGDSIGPLFNQWLIYYDDVRSPITSDMIGRLCVVGLLDDRILVKMIRRSRAYPGMFDLHSNNPAEPPIEGVEIAWAARVKNMVPR